MRIFISSTSLAGRVLGALAMLVLVVMAFGAAVVAVDAFDGGVSIRIRRGGRISLSGWRAILYGIGSVLLGLSFVFYATSCGFAVVAPTRCGLAIWLCFRAGIVLFAAAAVVTFINLVSVFF
jgi:hypothetical protein